MSEPTESGMPLDPLVIRYQNDVYFHNLVNRIRQLACLSSQTEAVWRDATKLAFQMERGELPPHVDDRPL